MAIAFGSSGTGASGTTSATPTLPAATVDGELLIAWAVTKYAAPDAAPTGWTQLGTVSGGHGASGSNTGTVTTTAYYRISSGNEGGSTAYTWTVTGGNVIRVNISRYTKAEGDQWVTPTFNSVANSGTPSAAWAATANADPGLAAGDILCVCAGINSSQYTYSALAYTAVGCTFGTVTARFANQVNTGDHCEPVSSDATVNTGPSSAAPVFTMTSSGSATDNPAGATVFVRLRASTTSTIRYTTKGGQAAGTTSVILTLPSSIAVGNVLLMSLWGKHPSNFPTTPTGWTALATASSSSGQANASDAGDVWVATYYRIADGTEPGTLTVTVSSGSVVVGDIHRITVAAGYTPDIVAVTGNDNTSHTAVSITFSSNPGMQVDDLLFTFVTGNNSVGSQTAVALEATGFGAQMTNLSYGQAAGGDKLRSIDNKHTVNVGPATAAPVYSYTAANATITAGVLVRIRGVQSVGASAGTATATATGIATSASPGSSTGTSTVAGVGLTQSIGAGTSSGTSTVSATSIATAASPGASDGAATPAGVGAASAVSPGSSAGTSSVSGVGAGAAATVGSSTGTSTVAAVGFENSAGVGSSIGTSTVTATGAAASPAVGASSGVATTTAVGASEADAVGSSAGTSTASGTGNDLEFGDGTSTGTSTVAGVGASESDSVGVSSGTAAVTAVGAVEADATGATSGTATVAGIGAASTLGVGASSGTAAVAGTGAGAGAGAGTSDGTSTVVAVGAGTENTVGSTAGTTTVSGVGAGASKSVGASVGTSTVSGAGLAIFSGAGSSSGVAAVTSIGRVAGAGIGVSVGTSTVNALGTKTSVIVVGPPPKVWLPRVRRAIPLRTRTPSRTTRS